MPHRVPSIDNSSREEGRRHVMRWVVKIYTRSLIQNCHRFFKKMNGLELLLWIVTWLLASTLLLIKFPTLRKGIEYIDQRHRWLLLSRTGQELEELANEWPRIINLFPGNDNRDANGDPAPS